MSEVTLGPDAGRALQEAENFCWRANVAIVAADHVLAGAMVVLAGQIAGLPSRESLEAALLMAHGSGSDKLTQNVMFGSSARDAVSTVARWAREAGLTEINARMLALGVLASGEVGPMFFSAAGVTKDELRTALEA
ncbi:MAG: hypothetical protein ACKVVT_14000 [Dehalococcoidia bacterium]